MKLRLPLLTAGILAALLAACSAVTAQTAALRVPVTVTDSSHHTQTVYFGVNPAATYCIDPALGEFELPANRCGSSPLCVYFTDPRSVPSSCFGYGLLLDLRAFISPAQTDTYLLVLTAADFPATVRWIPGLATWYDSMSIADNLTGTIVTADMCAVDSVIVPFPAAGRLIITAHGPHGNLDAVRERPFLPGPPLLAWNYPNPFNPATTIRFVTASAENVNLAVYDILGRHVAILIDRRMEPGEHTVQWTPAGVSAGVYLYRLSTPEGMITRSMLYLP